MCYSKKNRGKDEQSREHCEEIGNDKWAWGWRAGSASLKMSLLYRFRQNPELQERWGLGGNSLLHAGFVSILGLSTSTPAAKGHL